MANMQGYVNHIRACNGIGIFATCIGDVEAALK